MKGAAERTAAARSHERFRITSYLQLFREADSIPALGGRRVHSSHSSFSRRSFFEARRWRNSTINNRSSRSDSNEVETGKYSGSWFPRPDRDASSFPPSPPKCFQRLALGNCIQSQQRNCSRISRDSSRRSTNYN